ncbi:hypothetical protein B9Z19DRAFT_1073607 [Tuber borchii]|uniref:Uncharacterized protein n=1 Tax=Tuber borchii TaxID=42251 RepID=A0A2T7A5H8_TUBBO|nr:hypothetical protein B9Z19DRAFT_1073607 [Tuber borchii]
MAAELTTVRTDGSLESKPRGRCIQDLYSESEMASGLERLGTSLLGAISNLKKPLFSPSDTWKRAMTEKKSEGFDLDKPGYEWRPESPPPLSLA